MKQPSSAKKTPPAGDATPSASRASGIAHRSPLQFDGSSDPGESTTPRPERGPGGRRTERTGSSANRQEGPPGPSEGPRSTRVSLQGVFSPKVSWFMCLLSQSGLLTAGPMMSYASPWHFVEWCVTSRLHRLTAWQRAWQHPRVMGVVKLRQSPRLIFTANILSKPAADPHLLRWSAFLAEVEGSVRVSSFAERTLEIYCTRHEWRFDPRARLLRCLVTLCHAVVFGDLAR